MLTQAVQPTTARIAAFELLEEWGMDFGRMPTTGISHQDSICLCAAA